MTKNLCSKWKHLYGLSSSFRSALYYQFKNHLEQDIISLWSLKWDFLGTMFPRYSIYAGPKPATELFHLGDAFLQSIIKKSVKLNVDYIWILKINIAINNLGTCLKFYSSELIYYNVSALNNLFLKHGSVLTMCIVHPSYFFTKFQEFPIRICVNICT